MDLDYLPLLREHGDIANSEMKRLVEKMSDRIREEFDRKFEEGLGLMCPDTQSSLDDRMTERTKNWGLSTLAFPIHRRMFSSLIANELVSVQPMSLSSAMLFYMDYRIESKSPEVGPALDVYDEVPWVEPPNERYLDCPTCAGGGHGACIAADALAKEHDDYVAANYPHVCPRCSAPAYVGFMRVECSEPSCL